MADKMLEDAIDDAKSFWDATDFGPLAPKEFVLIRELCHALETILHNLPSEDPGEDYKPEGYATVLAALQEGDLVAVTLKGETIIPASSWAHNDREFAFDAGFWDGVIERNEHCRGFLGHLPVVPREVAKCWLSAQVPWLSVQVPCDEPKKRGRSRKQERALAAYDALYPKGHGGVYMVDVIHEVTERLGEPVSTRTLQYAIEARKKGTQK